MQKKNKNKIKILHIITRLCAGGAQENTLHTVEELQKNYGYEVFLIYGSLSKKEKSLENKAQKLGLNIYYIKELQREINLVKDFIAFIKILFFLKKYNFTIVHTHTSKAGLLGRLAAKIVKVPIIIHTPHGHVFHSYFSSFKEQTFILLEKWLANFTHKLIALTKIERNEHLKFKIGNRKKWTIIFSGIEIKKFQKKITKKEKVEIKKQIGFKNNDIILGTIGRLVPVKGQQYLIKAMPEIIKKFPNAKLIIIGEGELRKKLQILINKLNLKNKVKLLGHSFLIHNIIKVLDIFILPSLNEGMGKVIIQAQAAGVPVIASEVGGVKDLIKNNYNGFLVPPKDTKALAQKILFALNNKEEIKKVTLAAQKNIEFYSVENMIKNINEIYEVLLSQYYQKNAC